MRNLVFCGDIHGEFESAVYKLSNCAETVLIVCGDAGMGFYKDEYYFTLFRKLNLKLSKAGNHLVMFRGNHDNPDCFDGSFRKYRHLHLIPDYTVVEVVGQANVLCIGGATSIDRTHRIREEMRSGRKTYWGNAELPVFDESKLDEINGKYADNIQIVATHTCPSFAYPNTRQGIGEWLKIDADLNQTLDEERGTMDGIFGKLQERQANITDWYYGHFHEHKTERHHNINFRLCDCGEMNEFRSVQLRINNYEKSERGHH
jgi:DNA repair exonuclease SbcCD nuclease subunit